MKTPFNASVPSGPDYSHRRVLVVDDDPVIRHMYVSLLGTEGYQVETAEDGAAALERVADETFDLIVTDRFMPNLDGATMVLALRSAGLRIPIIMISRSLAHTALPAGVAREISAVLPKPVAAAHVSSAVAGALRSRCSDGAADPGNLGDAPSAAMASLPPLVQIVLEQAVLHRQRGAITAMTFERQMERIVKEELEPRGLEMRRSELPGHRICLLITTKITQTPPGESDRLINRKEP